MLWEQVLQRDVLYVKDRPYFHSFMGKDQVTALSFADEGEATVFADKYYKRQRKHAPPPPPPTNMTPPPTTPPTAIPIGNSATISDSPKKKKKGGLFSFGKSAKSEAPKIDKSMISAPSNMQYVFFKLTIRHVSHVGYSPKTGFSVMVS
jgi:hypothetical protein